MNYLDSESVGARFSEDDSIEEGLELLPVIGASLFAGISHLGQAYHLTPAQVKVLLLFGARDRMTVGEIASSLAVSMPAASELVDRLVDAGHLARATDPQDRRRVVVSATPEAREIGAALRELRRAQLQQAMAELRPEERPRFTHFLRALVIGLKHGTENATPCQSMMATTIPSHATTRDIEPRRSAEVSAEGDHAVQEVLP